MEAMMIDFVAGYLAAHFTEWAKQHPNIPFVSEHTPIVVRLLVSLLSIVAQILEHVGNGTITSLSSGDAKVIFSTLLHAILTYVMAEFTYRQSIKPKALPPA